MKKVHQSTEYICDVCGATDIMQGDISNMAMPNKWISLIVSMRHPYNTNSKPVDLCLKCHGMTDLDNEYLSDRLSELLISKVQKK